MMKERFFNMYGKEYYEKDAASNCLWGSAREIAIAENVLKHISSDVRTIIDIGCGDGYVLYKVKNLKKKNVYAFDISRKRLEYSRENIPGLKLVEGDILHLPFKDACFDLVICSEVIEHIADYKTAIKELARIARIQVIATVPNDEEPVEVHCPKCAEAFTLSGHLHRFTGSGIRIMLLEDKRVSLKALRGFYTIYSYNSKTLKLPAFLRIFFDRSCACLSEVIPFFKPNFLIIDIRKKRP